MPNLELDRLKEDPWQKQHLFLSRTDGHHESKFGLVNLDSSRTHSIAEKEQRAESRDPRGSRQRHSRLPPGPPMGNLLVARAVI